MPHNMAVTMAYLLLPLNFGPPVLPVIVVNCLNTKSSIPG